MHSPTCRSYFHQGIPFARGDSLGDRVERPRVKFRFDITDIRYAKALMKFAQHLHLESTWERDLRGKVRDGLPLRILNTVHLSTSISRSISTFSQSEILLRVYHRVDRPKCTRHVPFLLRRIESFIVLTLRELDVNLIRKLRAA